MIGEQVSQAYGLPVVRVEFLPLGADANTAVYRLTSREGERYFLKLRIANFDQLTVVLPGWLHTQGIRQVMAPLQTKAGGLWSKLNEYTAILYPYLEGQNACDSPLSEAQWIEFGRALRAFHDTCLPADLREKIKVERLSPRWRERARAFQQQAEQIDFTDPAAEALAALMRERREEIRHVIARAEALAEALRGRALEPVLCHGDLHAYNLLITPAGDFYIVDWDDPILAARERDLMFIGAGIGGIWNTEREETAFYRGYGAMKINRTALAYYRYERIVEVKGGIVEVRYRRVGVDELDRRLAMVEQVQYPFG